MFLIVLMFIIIVTDHCTCGKERCMRNCIQNVFGPYPNKSDAEEHSKLILEKIYETKDCWAYVNIEEVDLFDLNKVDL
jgi:excinuclease UvrABC nuclease subunit